MPVVARIMFGLVNFAARNGLAALPQVGTRAETGTETRTERKSGAPSEKKLRARSTGIRGETYAYWYLRRLGYVFLARNYTTPGLKGEIDLVGYDGAVLAFVEVKTRAGDDPAAALPEDALTPEKRRVLSRIAWRFLNDWRLRAAPWRFDVLAIESRPGRSPVVRLHKNAFPPSS
jgi:putative endonuclease